jgi:G3E family GTPase
MKDTSCEVILIAGFLGAGKTTLLRNILQWPGDPSRTAVLVNEFGQIGIDGELLQGFTTPVYELTIGCICCTLQGDFPSIIVEILDGFRPKRILIEATGVADPYDILNLLKASRIEKRISAPKVVAVLAGDLWEGREYFGPLSYNQIKAAELLLFNKIDLLSKEEVPLSLREIREINPACSVVPTHHCHVDPEVLWDPGVGGDHQTGFRFPNAHTEHGSAEEMRYLTFAFEDRSAFNADCFHRFIESLPIDIYRVKGFALLEDKRFFLNHVGGKTEWVELDEVGPTKLAFVGWQVNEEETLEALKVCLNP